MARVIETSSRTRFYFYTRSWRIPTIRPVLEQMAALPNCSAWYSCDRDTGIPDALPGIRLAWLQVDINESIPPHVDLVFRRHGIRRRPLTQVSNHVCPEQDGSLRHAQIACEQCQLCIRPVLQL